MDLGAWTWGLELGSLDLGAWTWERGLGDLDLGAWTWELGLGDLDLEGWTWGTWGLGLGSLDLDQIIIKTDERLACCGQKRRIGSSPTVGPLWGVMFPSWEVMVGR